MLLTDVLALIETTLLNDADINAFCQQRFGRRLFVFCGIDPKDPPEYKYCPMVCLATGPRAREAAQDYYSHGLNVGVSISQDKITKTDWSVHFDGADDLNTLARLVERRITLTLNSAGIAGTQEPGYEDVINPPYFEAVWSYSRIRCQDLLK